MCSSFRGRSSTTQSALKHGFEKRNHSPAKWEISCIKKTPGAAYIGSVQLNGKPYSKNYITYADIMNGGKIVFKLQDVPNKTWGVKTADQPLGLSAQLHQ